MRKKRIAILGSIPDEIHMFKKLKNENRWNHFEIEPFVAGIGKTAAAMTTQRVVMDFEPDIMFYTGFGGALESDIGLHDIAVVSSVIDADLDARAFEPSIARGQNPFTGDRVFNCDDRLVTLALQAQGEHTGFDAYVATTSQFLNQEGKESFIKEIVPQLKAASNGQERYPNVVDMESSGFVTVAAANNVPCLVLRNIANTVQQDALSEYLDTVLKRVENYYAIVVHILDNLPNDF